jgi:hypothetical protein
VSHETKKIADVEMSAVQEQPPAWSTCEVASLFFSMYNLGEGELKQIVLEDPTSSLEKRSEAQIALKWREIKYFCQQKCPDYEPQEQLLIYLKSLLLSIEPKEGEESPYKAQL